MAEPRPTRPHYLATNERVSSPDCVAVFDTESTWNDENGYQVHRPRCWAAICVIRHEAEPEHKWVRKATGTIMADLARTLDGWGRERRETWLYAHNVGFDLALSALPLQLIELGWTTEHYWFGPEITWMVFHTKGHRIVVTDSFSWLSASLEEIGHWLKRQKRPLPANDAEARPWELRALGDCRILMEALLTIMDWWDDQALGTWSITGASCGWHAARHMMAAKAIVVGGDVEIHGFERGAIYGGRREAFVTGYARKGLVVDWDFRSAHATVMASTPLPVRPGRTVKQLGSVEHLIALESVGVIAEGIVTTDRPCVPVRHHGEIWWPTGTFRTRLASPELRLLLELGGTFRPEQAVAYPLGTALVGFGRFVLAVTDGHTAGTPEVCRKVVKGWGRSSVGKFAQRSARVLSVRPATRPGWHYEHGRMEEGDAEVNIITLNGMERILVRDQEGPDSLPAVFAFVESHTRSALSRLILEHPDGAVLQCDTDGYLEWFAGEKSVRPPAEVPPPFYLVAKGRYHKVRVLAAQQLELDGQRRMAGVARHAVALGNDAYAWRDWPGLRWQLAHSTPGVYLRRPRAVQLHLNQVRRWILEDGSTLPVEMELDGQAENQIVAWQRRPWYRAADRLAPLQHPLLTPLS